MASAWHVRASSGARSHAGTSACHTGACVVRVVVVASAWHVGASSGAGPNAGASACQAGACVVRVVVVAVVVAMVAGAGHV